MATAIAALVAARIREARARSGLSEAEFAAMVGMSRRAVRYWSSGRSTPTVEMLVRIAVTCDVPSSWLLMPLDGREHQLVYGEAPCAAVA